MKFFIIEDIAEQFQIKETPPLTNSGITHLIELIASSSIDKDPLKKELIAFLDYINTPKNLVFYSWVLDTKEIKNALVNEQFANFNLSQKSFYKHVEREHFFHFLNPFLTPLLERKIYDSELPEMYSILFYGQLLTEENRLSVQAQLKPKVEAMLETIRAKENIGLAFNVKFIDLLNFFDRSFYTIRSVYIKVISQLLLDETLSITEKQKLATASRRLHLNEDHQEELNTFIKKAGLNQLRKAKVGNLNKRIFILFVILFVASFAFLMNKKDNSQTDDELIIIPPYGTDSLSEKQIKYLNAVFKLELDTINKGTIPVGLDMENFFDDTLK